MIRSLTLIGYRGTGKTSVGMILAKRLGYQFADTDQLIETKTGETIASIFERGGESLFRNYETSILKTLESVKKPLIIAAGGGLPLKKENQKILRQLAPRGIVLLTADPDTIAERITQDLRSKETRPPLTQLSFHEEILSVLKKRSPIYLSLADLTVSTDKKDTTEIADEIIQKISKGSV